MKEEWKDINGYEGFYKVSNLGRVKSLGGRCGASRHPKILSKSITKDGYEKVRLYCNGTDKSVKVHRLVAKAFIPNPCKKDTVNHIDGNKLNNVVTNLEWANRSEQMLHAYVLGLKTPKIGSSNPVSKLTDDDVKEIRKCYVRGSTKFGTVALGKKYGVTNVVIGLIVRNMSYTNVK